MTAWLGVVSRAHVQKGVAGGFAQLCHGKAQPLRRMRRGDWLVYYSPTTEMGGAALRAFTAIGQVEGTRSIDTTWAVDLSRSAAMSAMLLRARLRWRRSGRS